MSARNLNTLFITGTDTGVGKTVFTLALLWELRRRGVRALAMKPFCSGERSDAERIQSVQGPSPTLEEINPYYFSKPLTPLVAAQQERRRITLTQALQSIAALQKRAEILLVEGAGGLLSPLGDGFAARELIQRLSCRVVVVAPNRLGTINHTRMTVELLQAGRSEVMAVVLMEQRKRDASARSNALLLRRLLGSVGLVEFPYLGVFRGEIGGLKKRSKILKKTLAAF